MYVALHWPQLQSSAVTGDLEDGGLAGWVQGGGRVLHMCRNRGWEISVSVSLVSLITALPALVSHHYSNPKGNVVIKVKTGGRCLPGLSEQLLQNQLSLCFKSILAKG